MRVGSSFIKVDSNIIRERAQDLLDKYIAKRLEKRKKFIEDTKVCYYNLKYPFRHAVELTDENLNEYYPDEFERIYELGIDPNPYTIEKLENFINMANKSKEIYLSRDDHYYLY